MDMSRAFVTIQRGFLLQYLKSILSGDEFNTIKVLIQDVQLTVRRGVLFTLYHQALKEAKTATGIPTQLKDHTYTTQTNYGTLINLQDADDIC